MCSQASIGLSLLPPNDHGPREAWIATGARWRGKMPPMLARIIIVALDVINVNAIGCSENVSASLGAKQLAQVLRAVNPFTPSLSSGSEAVRVQDCKRQQCHARFSPGLIGLDSRKPRPSISRLDIGQC